MSEVEKKEIETLEEFLPKLPQITKYKSNRSGEGGLAFLKDFYTEVWESYDEYVENDKFLYKIFSDKTISKRIKAIVLNKLYSAGMFDIEVEKFVKQFTDKKDIGIVEYERTNNKGNCNKRKLISMESKYLHWHNEVNNEEAPPVYDKNVRMVLNAYKLIKSSKKDLQKDDGKKDNEYTKVKEAIDKFIEKIGINEEDKKNLIEIKKVSLYRLVDKFLWLSYKIYKYQNPKAKEDEKNDDNGENKNDEGSTKSAKEKEGLEKVAEKYEELIKKIKSSTK